MITPEEKEKSAETERIRNKLLENRKFSWGRTLEKFAAQLKESNISTRTQRLYLATAEAFCQFVKLDNRPWSNDDISRFLKHKPGLRANLFKFVGHCNNCYDWDVKMPARGRTNDKVQALPRTVLQLQKLLRKVESDGLDKVDPITLARIIAKSLGFSTKIILNLSATQFHIESNNLVLNVHEEIINIPAELTAIVNAYIEYIK